MEKSDYVTPKKATPGQIDALLTVLQFDDPKKLAQDFDWFFHMVLSEHFFLEWPMSNDHYQVMHLMGRFLCELRDER